MAWTAARDQLASLVEASTPSTKKGGVTQPFKHFKDASEENIPKARGFWFLTGGPEVVDPLGNLSLAHTMRQVQLVIAYPAGPDTDLLTEIMEADYLVVAARLANETLWNRPSSTIVCIAGAGPFLSATKRTVKTAQLLSIAFSLEVTP